MGGLSALLDHFGDMVGVFSFYLPRERKVYKRYRVVFRFEEVDVVEVGLFFYRFSLI